MIHRAGINRAGDSACHGRESIEQSIVSLASAFPSGSDGRPVGAHLERSDPVGRSGRASAQDRHARGDERDLLSASDRLSVALSAARVGPSLPRSNGLQHLPQVPARGSLGRRSGLSCFSQACASRPVGRPVPPAAIIDSQSLKSKRKKRAVKAGVKTTQWVTTRRKEGQGRKLHALVDTEGFPLRVIVHSAGIQDRDGAAFWSSTKYASGSTGSSWFGPTTDTTPGR